MAKINNGQDTRINDTKDELRKAKDDWDDHVTEKNDEMLDLQ